jgi:hypothetical protein
MTESIIAKILSGLPSCRCIHTQPKGKQIREAGETVSPSAFAAMARVAAASRRAKIAEGRGCRADEGGGAPADASDGPVGVPVMTGRHVVGGGHVLAAVSIACARPAK